MAEFVNSNFTTGTPAADLDTFTGGHGETYSRFSSYAANHMVFTAAPIRARPNTPTAALPMVYVASPTPAGPDYSVTLVASVVGSITGDQIGMQLRLNTANGFCYFCYIQDNQLIIHRDTASPGYVDIKTIVSPTARFTLVATVTGATISCTFTPEGGSTVTASGTDGAITAAGMVATFYTRGTTGALSNSSAAQFESLVAATAGPTTVSYPATAPEILYTGRWALVGSDMQTINNGADFRFGFGGNLCRLVFNVAGLTARPALAYWVDGAGPIRVALDGTGVVNLTLPANLASSPPVDRHYVRVQVSVDYGFPTGATNWSAQDGAAKLTTVTLNVGRVLTGPMVPLGYLAAFGDSITAGERVLYAGAGEGVATSAPELAWPEFVGRSLGLAPVVDAHGGQGILHTGTDGAPAANAAFPYAWAGQAWTAPAAPLVVVVLFGNNDMAAPFTAAQYAAYLTTLHTAYPQAWIFCVNPPGVNLFAPISGGVALMGDSRFQALDYQSGVWDSGLDCTDGTHPNVGGHLALALQLTNDIRARFAALGVSLGIGAPGGGGGAGRMPSIGSGT